MSDNLSESNPVDKGIFRPDGFTVTYDAVCKGGAAAEMRHVDGRAVQPVFPELNRKPLADGDVVLDAYAVGRLQIRP